MCGQIMKSKIYRILAALIGIFFIIIGVMLILFIKGDLASSVLYLLLGLLFLKYGIQGKILIRKRNSVENNKGNSKK